MTTYYLPAEVLDRAYALIAEHEKRAREEFARETTEDDFEQLRNGPTALAYAPTFDGLEDE